MPYRRQPRPQRKHSQSKIANKIIKKYTPEKRSFVKFGIVPQSVTNPISHKPLTQKLASSSKKDRDDAISHVQNILSCKNKLLNRSEMTQLWYALFYSFWHSDKVLIQQELARKLSNFIKICSTNDISILYIECFIECMRREWKGIDYYRMSKFLSLFRYFIHSIFDYLALNEWNVNLTKQISNIFRYKINLLDSSNRGLFLHLNDIYIDELIKINRIEGDDHLIKNYFRPNINFDSLYNLLIPFINIYLESNKIFQKQYVITKIFNKLMESMTFNAEIREINLNNPGKDNLDLYYNHKILNDNDGDNDNDNDQIMIEKHKKKRKERHLMFDKKNYDVVMPFNDYINENDKEKMKLLRDKCVSDVLKRKNDPLLMKDKIEKFNRVFDYLANHNETPKKHKNKLRILSEIFILKTDSSKLYNRDAVKKAIKLVRNTRKIRKLKMLKKRHKKKMRRIMNHKRKWNKLKKQGLKIKPTQKLLKRVSRHIV